MVKVRSLLQKSLIFLLQVYRYLISPLLRLYCRFYLSCSNHALIAIRRFYSCKGSYMAVCRLLRCHPWHIRVAMILFPLFPFLNYQLKWVNLYGTSSSFFIRRLVFNCFYVMECMAE